MDDARQCGELVTTVSGGSERTAAKGRQGEAIGRLGTVEVMVEIAEGRPKVVRVGGCAVIVFKFELVMPDDGHPAFT